MSNLKSQCWTEPGFPIVFECRNGVVSRHFLESFHAESEPACHLMSQPARRATTHRKQGIRLDGPSLVGRRSQGIDTFVSPLGGI
jgi:hypothetical protein